MIMWTIVMERTYRWSAQFVDTSRWVEWLPSDFDFKCGPCFWIYNYVLSTLWVDLCLLWGVHCPLGSFHFFGLGLFLFVFFYLLSKESFFYQPCQKKKKKKVLRESLSLGLEESKLSVCICYLSCIKVEYRILGLSRCMPIKVVTGCVDLNMDLDRHQRQWSYTIDFCLIWEFINEK